MDKYRGEMDELEVRTGSKMVSCVGCGGEIPKAKGEVSSFKFQVVTSKVNSQLYGSVHL